MRPLPRAGNQAREPRRRETPARGRGRPRSGYARIRVPLHGPVGGGGIGNVCRVPRGGGAIRNVRRVLRGGGADGTEWNETGERNDMQEADGHDFEEGRASCLKRLQHMRYSHAKHDIA